MAAASEESGLSLIKKLASCDQSVRDRALRSVLESWLPTQSRVSDEDMKKLWQGLFYCVWHADKAPYQSQLIDRLSSAVTSLELSLSVHYFSVFLLTIRREWPRIDRLRLDKFYLLIRRFLGGFFLVLKNNSWDLELTRRLMGVLVDWTFLADDKFLGNGVNYHIASVFVEEVREFLPLRKEVVELVFGPFVKVLGLVSDKILVGKIKSSVFDELLTSGRKLLEATKSDSTMDSGDEALGSIALSMGFSTRLYELGSSPDCCQGNRKPLFTLHEEFLKLEKDMASSGFEIKISEDVSHEDNDVPALIPISSETEVDNSATNSNPPKRGLKESKKASEKSKKKSKKVNSEEETKGNQMDDDDGNRDSVSLDASNSEGMQDGDGNAATLDDAVIMNLRLQFEKAASEMGSSDGVISACDRPDTTSNGKSSKKRKRKKNRQEEHPQSPPEVSGDVENGMAGKSCEMGAKRVRFSMKNNLVWKPNNPLPPQSLRIPPSVVPRGSALKKGIPPGPIREMPSPKAKRKAKAVKKTRKGLKTVKRLKKKKSSPTKE